MQNYFSIKTLTLFGKIMIPIGVPVHNQDTVSSEIKFHIMGITIDFVIDEYINH